MVLHAPKPLRQSYQLQSWPLNLLLKINLKLFGPSFFLMVLQAPKQLRIMHEPIGGIAQEIKDKYMNQTQASFGDQ